jgi:multiple sugar transport system permease protein
MTSAPSRRALPWYAHRHRFYRGGATLLIYAGLLALGAFVIFPFFWIVSTSLRPQAETFLIPAAWLPAHPTIEAYIAMWSARPYAHYMLNSFWVALATTTISVMIASLAGYGFSRFRLPAARPLLFFVLSTQMVPAIVVLLSYFRVVAAAGLFNTLTSLVITYTASVLPYAVWMMQGSFDGIPRELEEAAFIDGASHLGAFLRIVLPVSAPGIIATAIFCFLQAWNEFTFAYVLTSSDEKYTISVGIAHVFGEYSVAWNELMAVGMVTSIVPITLYFLTSRYLVSGLTAGALK